MSLRGSPQRVRAPSAYDETYRPAPWRDGMTTYTLAAASATGVVAIAMPSQREQVWLGLRATCRASNPEPAIATATTGTCGAVVI